MAVKKEKRLSLASNSSEKTVVDQYYDRLSANSSALKAIIHESRLLLNSAERKNN